MTSDAAHPATSGMPTEAAAELRLDDQLCFALYSAASAVVRNYRPLLADLGLTYPQYILMMTLWEHDHRTTSTDATGAGTSDPAAADINVGEIAARLRVPVSNLTPILDRLVDAGLLQRQRSSRDRRHVDVALTDTGRALERQAAQAQHQVRCQTELSAHALDSLRGELHALTHTLDENL